MSDAAANAYEAMWKQAEDDLRKAAARIERLEGALRWYRDMADGCRKVTSEGNDARRALDKDGGQRARAALGEEPSK